MGIKLMSAIFETEFRDLPIGEAGEDGKERMAKASSLKIVLLALADHANEDGECYPGYTRLEKKTGLSRQGVSDVIKALKHNGLVFVSEEKSKLGTNYYAINTGSFPHYRNEDDDRLLVKSLDYPSQVTLPEVVKSLDLNPQLTPIKPSLENSEKKPKFDLKNSGLDWKILAGEEVTQEDQDKNILIKTAQDSFERDMGFNPLPWDSTKDWQKMSKFVVQEYEKDNLIFAKYKTWQKEDGKYVALSNRKIKERPGDFIACFPDFLAHTAMYPRVEKIEDDNDDFEFKNEIYI